MAHETEAACLLRTGAQYTRRLGVPLPGGELVFAGIKHGAFSLYFGDDPIFHFDLEGRWQRAYGNGVHYRKALDGTVDAIERMREGTNLVLHRRALTFAEAVDLDEAIRAAALAVAQALARPNCETIAPPEGSNRLDVAGLREVLDRVARWDAEAWFAHRERYLATYGPLPFLPPDCHQAAILQATVDRPSGRAFGAAATAPAYTRTSTEFADHCANVAALLGRRAAQCRNVFLAGADLLWQPVDQVARYLETISQFWPIDPSAASQRRRDLPEDAVRALGIDAFVDDYGPGLPDAAGWQRLRALNLRRLNLGIESGDPDIRGRFGKTWVNSQLLELVAAVKTAEIDVRLILLVGAGGKELSEAHAAGTAGLANSLPLSRADLVYLVAIGEVGRTPAGLTPLAAEESLREQAALKQLLAPIRERSAKVVPYTREKEWN